MGRDVSLDVSYDEQDLMKEAESAGEEKIVKENLIIEDKVTSEEEMKKNEVLDRVDEFSMMEAYMSKSESIPVIKESEVDKVVEEKHTVKDDKKSQEEYIEETKKKKKKKKKKYSALISLF